jgi:hypothetical protein
LVQAAPFVHEVIIFRRRDGWRAFWRLLMELRKRRFDVVWDMQGLLRSGLMTAAADSPEKWGRPDAREGAGFFYNRRVEMPAGTGPHHALEVLQPFLKTAGVVPRVDFPLRLKSDAAFQWQNFFEHDPRKTFVIFTDSRGAGKEWPRFSELTDLMFRSIPEARIEEARRAYQRAFDGVETIVVGREALVDPRLDNPEIFHLDMVTAVLGTPRGAVAFVPTYAAGAVDSLSHVHLTVDAVKRFQAEYDRTARQMAARGYRVARVAFADHPARSPVGIAKLVDPATGRSIVILGRYPDHLADSDERNAQTQLQIAFEGLDVAVEAWRHAPTDVHWKAVQSAVGAAWRQMEASVASPNAMYERARKVFESYGVDVIELPIYPTGEGGIHCLLLK